MINHFLILSFCLDFFLFFLLIIKSYKIPSNRIFAFSTLAVGLWTLGIFMFRITKNLELALFWNREFIVASSIIASTFLHFSLLKTKTRLKPIFIFLIHLPNICFFISAFIPNLMITKIIVRDWGKESILGYIYPVFGVYFSIYIILALLKLYFEIKKLVEIERIKLQYIFYATLLTSIVGAYFNLYLILIGNYKYIWVGPYNSLILVTIISYAILKKRVLDVSVIIKKTTSYIIASIFIIPIFGLTAYSTLNKPLFLIFSIIILGLLASFGGKWFQEFLITTKNRLFIKGWYDPKTIIANITTRLKGEQDRMQLFKTIESELYNGLELEQSHIIIAERDKDEQLAKYLMMTDDSLETIAFMPDDGLITFFDDHKEAVSLDELAPELYPPFQSFDGYKEKKQVILIPFYSPEMLEGIVVLGERSNGVAYKKEDYALFQAVVNNVSGVLYRLTPYETLSAPLNFKHKFFIPFPKPAFLGAA